jgi:plastocyanin
LVAAVAVVLAALLLGVGAAVSDREAIALGVVALAGVAGLRVRSGALGEVVLGLLFLDTAGWLIPAAADNIANHDRFRSIVLPVGVGAVALVGLAAVAGRLLERRRAAPQHEAHEGRGPVVVVAGGACVMVGTLLVALLAGVGQGSTLPVGGAALSARNTTFVPDVLHARAAGETPSGTTVPQATGQAAPVVAGQVTVALTNHDLFWHTFTIDSLGVNLKVPVGGRRQVTFSAKPGTYHFYCAIPGHRAAGMEGTLVVR